MADNTDLYAFRSPDRPDTVHDHRQLHPARIAGGRAELPGVRRFGPLRDPRRQRRRRGRRPDLSVPLQDRDPQPEHLPLQHRSDRLARRSELEPAADLQRRRWSGMTSTIGRERPAERSGGDDDCSARAWRRLPTTSVRARRPNYEALAAVGGAHDPRRRQGVRRPARRSVLRRPRLDLRSGRTAAVQSGAPAAAARRSGTRRGRAATTPTRSRSRFRSSSWSTAPSSRPSASTPAPAGRRCGCCARTATTTTSAPTCRCRDSASR